MYCSFCFHLISFQKVAGGQDSIPAKALFKADPLPKLRPSRNRRNTSVDFSVLPYIGRGHPRRHQHFEPTINLLACQEKKQPYPKKNMTVLEEG